MTLTRPKCGTLSSTPIRNRDAIILIGWPKKAANGQDIPTSLKDMYLPHEYAKVNSTMGAKLNTQDLANNKDSSSELVGYNSELKFMFKVSQVDILSKKLDAHFDNMPVNGEAHLEIWEISRVTNPVVGSDGVTVVGDGFKVQPWIGPATSNIFNTSGDDEGMIEREIAIKPKSGCRAPFVINDTSLAPLIATWLKGEHWATAGVWDNETPNKIVAKK